MIFSVHLTENCNMNCAYCVREKHPKDMSMETMQAVCERIFSDGKTAGISFFGGEPLIKKELIRYALEYGRKKSEETGIPFHTKMTTNGVLLDDAFLQMAKVNGLVIALSFEGTAQDACRHMANGDSSFQLIEEKAKLLLSYLPDSYVLMTIAPNAVDGFADAVKYLYGLGFRKIPATIAYGKNVTWTEADFEKLSLAFDQIGEFYIECLLKGDGFFFSPFDGKITDMVKGKKAGERCHLGKRQMSVDVLGDIYPCTQFIGDPEYYLGNVYQGLDQELWVSMVQRSMNRQEPGDCVSCALRNRCQHTCGCANRLETGNENLVSPVQCAFERMIIEKSDRVADRIMEHDENLFMKKFT